MSSIMSQTTNTGDELQENAQFPGIFIKRRPRKETSPESSVTSSDDSSEVPAPPVQELSVPDPSGQPSTIFVEETNAEQEKRERRRRKKTAEGEENGALDPLRYKTTVCKNWVKLGKCPYGPRCLFAHGNKQLRTKAANNVVVEIATRSGSPTRTFREAGRFPSFMPPPPTLATLAAKVEKARPRTVVDSPGCEVSTQTKQACEIATQTCPEDQSTATALLDSPPLPPPAYDAPPTEPMMSYYPQPVQAMPSPPYLWPHCYPPQAYPAMYPPQPVCMYWPTPVPVPVPATECYTYPTMASSYDYPMDDGVYAQSYSSGSDDAGADVDACNVSCMSGSDEMNTSHCGSDLGSSGSFVHQPYGAAA